MNISQPCFYWNQWFCFIVKKDALAMCRKALEVRQCLSEGKRVDAGFRVRQTDVSDAVSPGIIFV